MSDETRIEPALTPDEWGYPRAVIAVDSGSARDTVSLDELKAQPENLPALIALANAALPDYDPRKLTHDRLYNLSFAIGRDDISQRDYAEVKAFVKALLSYLPPE